MSRFFDLDRTFVPPVRLRRETTALVVVDMQYHDASVDQGFNLAMDRIDPGSMDYFNERNEGQVVPGIRRLLDYARGAGVQVVHLTLGAEQRDLSDLSPRMREWVRAIEDASGVRDIFWRGNPAFAIREELAPLDNELVVNKKSFGAFNSSDLEERLRATGVETLLITGISTNCCVETTARDAADRGFAVAIVDEATADYDAEAHDAALRAFHFNFGRILGSVDDAIAALEEEAA